MWPSSSQICHSHCHDWSESSLVLFVCRLLPSWLAPWFSCGKVYIGETKCRLETHLKEHKDACIKGFTDKSAIAEHMWTEDHPIHCDDTKVLHYASQTTEIIGREGSKLHTNGIRELTLQLLDGHVQEDQRWSPCELHPPDCIVNWTANVHAQYGQLAIVCASKPKHSYKLRSPMT